MKVKVIYPDGVGLVDSNELDSLIAAGKIYAFIRSNKLVVIGIHETRKSKGEWNLPERRGKSEEKK